MKMLKHIFYILFLLLLAFLSRFYFVSFLDGKDTLTLAIGIISTSSLGVFLIKKTADIIEKTTAILKPRTGLAGGLLQALGTAFPDMVLGVVAAILSLQALATDHVKAINLAIIAAATTFGSNIYNIFHASWCLYRQNLANKLHKSLLMFPYLPNAGRLIPISKHKSKPPLKDLDDSLAILVMLSLLTSAVALAMVLFGKVHSLAFDFGSDLYQLNRPLGFLILVLSILVIFIFRKSHEIKDIMEEKDNFYFNLPTLFIWLELAVAAFIILLGAQGLIEAVAKFSEITHIPFVLSGVITALAGCLSEMIVIHNFSIHPKGRIADAVIGVAMDNIITTSGAAFIAIMGGIFLGSDALIIIFVLILFANTTLMHQISILKNYFLKTPVSPKN